MLAFIFISFIFVLASVVVRLLSCLQVYELYSQTAKLFKKLFTNNVHQHLVNNLNEAIIEVYKRLLREEKIESQQDFADKLKFHKSTVSEILNGRKPASKPFIKKFEEVFGKFKNTDGNMIVDGPTNGNNSKDNQHEHYNVRLKNERSGKIVMPKDAKKEDVQLVIEYLKLMLKSME